MIRGKLMLLLSAFSMGKEVRIDRDSASIDLLFKELTEIAHQLPKTIALAQSGATVSRQYQTTQPDTEKLDRSVGNIDVSRLPPEVAAVIARTPRKQNGVNMTQVESVNYTSTSGL